MIFLRGENFAPGLCRITESRESPRSLLRPQRFDHVSYIPLGRDIRPDLRKIDYADLLRDRLYLPRLEPCKGHADIVVILKDIDTAASEVSVIVFLPSDAVFVCAVRE